MNNISRDEFQKVVNDLMLIKNDVNTIKANTQINANLLSLLHSDDISTIVFKVANTVRLCKALMICKNPTTAKELCETLSVKAPNIRKQVIDKLVDGSLLTVGETKGRSELYVRVAYLDLINFDKLAEKKYPELKEI